MCLGLVLVAGVQIFQVHQKHPEEDDPGAEDHFPGQFLSHQERRNEDHDHRSGIVEHGGGSDVDVAVGLEQEEPGASHGCAGDHDIQQMFFM